MNTAVAAQYPLPDLAGVRELLGMLFDGLTVKAGAKLDVTPKSAGYAGIYVASDASPVALCACDLPFASISAAALSMMPPNAATAAIKAGELTPVMLANLGEVMNICSRLLLHEGTPHLKLAEVRRIKDFAPAVASIAASPKGRVDFEIGIGKYGSGVIAVLSR